MNLVQDKVTIITGGTRGIGFAAAKIFIDNGAKVSIFGETQEEVDTALAQQIGLTQGLGREIIRKNIRVVGVAPGVVNTDMTNGNPPEIMEGYLKALPMKRMLEPEEIANVYLFLASDLASGITATTVSVDGAYRP